MSLKYLSIGLLLMNTATRWCLCSDWSVLRDPNLLQAMMGDLAHGLSIRRISLVMDSNVADRMGSQIAIALSEAGVTVTLCTLNPAGVLTDIVSDIKTHMMSYKKVVYVFLMRRRLLEDVMNTISEGNLVQRNVLYFFLWNKFPPSRKFAEQIIEAMEVCVFVRNKHGNFNFYYNHKSSDGKGKLELVNWWSPRDRLFVHPLLPPTENIYRNFKGRIFKVPVVHKPPWYFVSYYNDSKIESVSGRDKKLLDLLASKLNFRLKHFDPPDRSQGSAIVNGTMKGVLATIWQREVEIFIGDLTVTYERSRAVDFTFPTLVDNEAFLTHAPGYLSEALALIRPFHWKVWPPVLLTIILSGPILFIMIKMSKPSSPIKPNNCDVGVMFSYTNINIKDGNKFVPKKSRIQSGEYKITDCDLLSNCMWVTFAIFLKQSCLIPSDLHKVRLVVIVLYLGATYVIGDMYSANLTSMLARPAREVPISTLEQLAEAMEKKEMQLIAELHSASHSNLENGTGVYERIWKIMKNQPRYLIKTSEMGMQGMQLVKENKHFALIGGRETFYYNTRRFGAHYFHLSEKLHTRYSAIALQIGCPFLENFNTVLMQLFEAGILAKITKDEYKKLVEDAATDERKVESVGEGKKATEDDSDRSQPRPMSMATLSGAFVVLSIGYVASILLLLLEIIYNKATISITKNNFLKLTRKSYGDKTKTFISRFNIVNKFNNLLK